MSIDTKTLPKAKQELADARLANAELELGRLAKRYRHNTRSQRRSNRIELWLHKTPIVTAYGSGLIQLNTGGWETVTTKRRMNEAIEAIGGEFKIYQEAFTWKVWRYDTQESSDYLDHQRYRLNGQAVPW